MMKVALLILFVITPQSFAYPTENDNHFQSNVLKNQQYYGQNPYNFDDPDCNRSSLQLITSKGYPGEAHYIITKDHYVLGVQRIPAGRGQKPDGLKKPVILLQHGLEGCSSNWIINMANQSLGYVLADAGVDVWLANSRGNTYSTNHTFLNPKKNPEFWQFSWDEMAKYDLPAMVDYILNVTGADQIYYAGHSQGTLIGFAQFSSDLNFAKKIKAFFALAPVAKVGNITAPIKKLAPYTEDIEILLDILGFFDWAPWNGLVHRMQYKACSNDSKDPNFCPTIMSMFFGKSTAHYNQTRLPVMISHCPAGTSTQNMAHYGQAVMSDQFQMYDYDFLKKGGLLNKLHYGQKTPPFYNVSQLNVPTIVFHSDVDALADPIDVAWLLSQINGTVVENYHYTDYTHGDFIFAMDAVDNIYNHIVDYISRNENLKSN